MELRPVSLLSVARCCPTATPPGRGWLWWQQPSSPSAGRHPRCRPPACPSRPSPCRCEIPPESDTAGTRAPVAAPLLTAARCRRRVTPPGCSSRRPRGLLSPASSGASALSLSFPLAPALSKADSPLSRKGPGPLTLDPSPLSRRLRAAQRQTPVRGPPPVRGGALGEEMPLGNDATGTQALAVAAVTVPAPPRASPLVDVVATVLVLWPSQTVGLLLVPQCTRPVPLLAAAKCRRTATSPGRGRS